MKQKSRGNYQKPLLELFEAETEDVCQVMSPAINPGLDPLTPVNW